MGLPSCLQGLVSALCCYDYEQCRVTCANNGSVSIDWQEGRRPKREGHPHCWEGVFECVVKDPIECSDGVRYPLELVCIEASEADVDRQWRQADVFLGKTFAAELHVSDVDTLHRTLVVPGLDVDVLDERFVDREFGYLLGIVGIENELSWREDYFHNEMMKLGIYFDSSGPIYLPEIQDMQETEEDYYEELRKKWSRHLETVCETPYGVATLIQEGNVETCFWGLHEDFCTLKGKCRRQWPKAKKTEKTRQPHKAQARSRMVERKAKLMSAKIWGE